MMSGHIAISIIGGIGFGLAAIGSYLGFRQHVKWAGSLLRVAALVAIAVGAAHLLRAVAGLGAVGALQNDFSAAVLLAGLIGLVGLGTHFSASLKGLDGFLFLVAAAVSFTGAATTNAPRADMTHRPWFISHALAFSLSATFFIAGGVAGVAYLLVNRMLRRKRGTSLVGSVAPLESLERFGRWMPLLGFPLFTYGILTGLYGVAHRPDLSHTAWYLDLTFLLSAVAWAVYAYLCAASLRGPHIRGRRAAVLSTYGLGLIVVVFFVREFSSRLHQ
ncbi:MAG: cytochrome c biogenesis protein CcsA [Planctomycetes bacterium]|nr:cytochrome c biogenesis protein CcsA [Planctomycetota bacterium]